MTDLAVKYKNKLDESVLNWEKNYNERYDASYPVLNKVLQNMCNIIELHLDQYADMFKNNFTVFTKVAFSRCTYNELLNFRLKTTDSNEIQNKLQNVQQHVDRIMYPHIFKQQYELDMLLFIWEQGNESISLHRVLTNMREIIKHKPMYCMDIFTNVIIAFAKFATRNETDEQLVSVLIQLKDDMKNTTN